MQKKIISTERAPRAIGPYSQAVVANGFVFTSGQIGLDPATGDMVAGGTAPQAERVLESLGEILRAAGSSFDQIVKATIYLTDLGEFATVNEIYARHVGKSLPARATVQVAALPKGATVEIDAIALVGSQAEDGQGGAAAGDKQ
jgi:2-iminobutanoate/2-iminopropanoate deaminase